MLTRIYGTAFLSKQDLERHLEMLEQARARDHRRLGPQLGLFVLRDEAPGMPFYLPNGMIVVNEIQRVLREQPRARRVRRDPHAARPRRRAVEALGPLGQLPREHVLHAVRRRGRARVRAEADELPRRVPRVRVGTPLVPRAAAAARGVRPLHAQRARGRAARAAARARVHAGRRTRLLHGGADRAGGARDHRGDRRAVFAVRVRRRARRAVDAAREVDRHRRAVGCRRSGRSRRRSRRWAASTR